MPSGGARVRSGPAPDPNALRREKKSDGEWTVLPSEGRAGDPPDWPLPEPSDRELERWEAEWAKPQAHVWEAKGQADIVALFVRRWCEAEQPGAATNLSNLVKQLADYLLLTIPAMHSARVMFAEDEVAKARSKPVKADGSVRDRLQAIGD